MLFLKRISGGVLTDHEKACDLAEFLKNRGCISISIYLHQPHEHPWINDWCAHWTDGSQPCGYATEEYATLEACVLNDYGWGLLDR